MKQWVHKFSKNVRTISKF